MPYESTSGGRIVLAHSLQVESTIVEKSGPWRQEAAGCITTVVQEQREEGGGQLAFPLVLSQVPQPRELAGWVFPSQLTQS